MRILCLTLQQSTPVGSLHTNEGGAMSPAKDADGKRPNQANKVSCNEVYHLLLYHITVSLKCIIINKLDLPLTYCVNDHLQP